MLVWQEDCTPRVTTEENRLCFHQNLLAATSKWDWFCFRLWRYRVVVSQPENLRVAKSAPQQTRSMPKSTKPITTSKRRTIAWALLTHEPMSTASDWIR